MEYNKNEKNEDIQISGINYSDSISDDEFLPPEIKSEIPATFKRKRYKKKTSPIIGILAGVFVVIIIVFALFWERAHRDEQQGSQDHDIVIELPPNYPPPGRSHVQDILNESDWLDRDFLPINEFSRPGILLNRVNGIVIHNIGNPNTTAQQNRNFFANLADTGQRHASSNFIICLDGRILQCVPVDEVAYASNHRNYDTISIELCHPDDTGAFNPETYDAAVFLTAWLCVQFNLTTNDVIRHSDIIQTDCPRYFTLNDGTWEAFLAAVDLKIAELRT